MPTVSHSVLAFRTSLLRHVKADFGVSSAANQLRGSTGALLYSFEFSLELPLLVMVLYMLSCACALCLL